jgi:transcription termination factor Rho
VKKEVTIAELDIKTLADLRKFAKQLGLKNFAELRKDELIIKILEEQTKKGGNIFAEGVLEIKNDGSHGVLRSLMMSTYQVRKLKDSIYVPEILSREGHVLQRMARSI